MTQLLTPPGTKFLLNAHPVNMHDEAIEWLSDLEFCKTELLFFTKVIDKYFLRIPNEKSAEYLASIDKQANYFRTQTLNELHATVVRHEHHLSELDEEMFSRRKEIIVSEHEELQKKMKDFLTIIKKFKKEIFDLVEGKLS